MLSPRQFILLSCLLAATACSYLPKGEATYPTRRPTDGDAVYTERPSVFGEGGLNLFGENDQAGDEESGATGIGVNAFLWRASLDTIAFMPVASADPFGGVIITDWYSPPATPEERFKANIFILDKTLRADGVRVALFRQSRDTAGQWVDAPVEADAATKLEDKILLRARELRINQQPPKS